MKIIGNYGPVRTKRTQCIAIAVAGLIVVMLLTQLFGYEDFATTLGTLLPFNDGSLLSITAAVIVIVELLALPYLLRMYQSPLMRIVSSIFATGVSLFWLFTAFTNSHAGNSGMFSTTLELSGGILPTALSLILFVGIVLVVQSDTHAAVAPLEKKS